VRTMVVLYDGVCGLCNKWVRFILRHDEDDKFRFAALQSEFAQNVLRQELLNNSVDTVYLVLDDGAGNHRLLTKSDAALEILSALGSGWAVMAGVLKVCPRPLRDRAYDYIARSRYRWFGRLEACPLPGPNDRRKFLDLQ
jgi:predicted DCC family thiol-disulfide oxidoreductase YuxK